MVQPITVNTPDSWADVTISQFQEIQAVNSSNSGIEVAAILIDKDPDEIRKYDVASLTKIMNALEWTSELPKAANYKQMLKVRGVEYWFVNRLTDLTLGEWVDLESYLEDSINNLHKIMALLYRPKIIVFSETQRIIEPYEVVSAAARAVLFKDNVSIDDVYGTLVFFSLIVKESTKIIPAYLLARKKMSLRDMLKLSKSDLREYVARRYRKNGTGTDIFTRSQREILRKWNRSLN
jgi:hypothetical protein